MNRLSNAHSIFNCSEGNVCSIIRLSRLKNLTLYRLWKMKLAIFAVSLLALGSTVQAQPAGRVLSGYPPGGAVDIIARVVAEEFSRSLGRTFIV